MTRIYDRDHPSYIHTGDDSKGYFVQPTVILTKNPQSVTMTDEIFGPVLTVSTPIELAQTLTQRMRLGLRLRRRRLRENA